MKLELFNDDCMNVMARYPDNYFDLAIVDPPYGLGKRTVDGGSKRNTQTRFMSDIRRSNWDDEKPSIVYFDEVMRVSRHHIIWGGNYFPISEYRAFIVWDKMTYVPTMSQVELAVTNFDSPARLIKINSNQSSRIHPTQKPVELYKWLYANYAKPGMKILDTHLGSGSNAIAAYEMNMGEFVGAELDADYFEAAQKRINKHLAQQKLF